MWINITSTPMISVTKYFVDFFRPVKLAYDALEGDPSLESSPIVIMHGLFGSKNNWSSLAKKMNFELARTVSILFTQCFSRTAPCLNTNTIISLLYLKIY